MRPSEHHVGRTSFLNENAGSIPPNVLVPALEQLLPDLLERLPELHGLIPIANTASSDEYLAHCRKHGVASHPARMPAKLVEFFVNFLTDSNDFVLDPFAGSNTTGFVAQQLGRRWIAIEQSRDYANASKARFA
jgi:DNA modification methylase